MSGPSASAPHPTTVGNTFVKQYYSLLTEFPEKLHRFYKDESTFSHGSGSQPEESVSGQTSINSTILKKNYNGAVVKLDHGSIDCQPSQAGGVVVLVTGVITLQNKQPAHFVQTFFLAVQENGYFVLNDVLRFLNIPSEKKPASPKKVVSAAPSPSKATQTQTKENVPTPTSTPTHAAVAAVKSPKNQPKAAPSPPLPPAKTPATPVEAVEVQKVLSPKRAPASPTKKPATPKATPVAAPVVEENKRPETPKKEEKVISPKGKHPKHAPKAKAVEEAPAPVDNGAPKSWASHLFAGTKKAPAVVAEPAKPAPASPAPAAPAAVKSPNAKASASWDDEPADEPTPAPTSATTPAKRVTYFSLYVRDVPVQTTSTELRDVFKSFGKIANTNVLDGKGYAFVDFFEEESVNSVLAALKDGNQFLVHDQVLHVSLRTPRDSNKSGGGRGRGNGSFTNGGRGGRGNNNRTNYQAKDTTAPRSNNGTSTQHTRENKGRGRGNSAGGRGQNSAAAN